MIKTSTLIHCLTGFILFFIFNGCGKRETCTDDYLLLAEEDRLSLNRIYKGQQVILPDSIYFGQQDTIQFFIDARIKFLNKNSCFTSRMEIRHFGDQLKIETIGSFDNTHPSGSNINDYCNIKAFYSGNLVKTVPVDRFNEFNNPAMPGFAILLSKRPTSHKLKFKVTNFNHDSKDSLICITPELHFIF
jgi:hypothetical protein